MSLTTPEDHSLLKELLYLERDEELGREDRRRLAQHLEQCHECRRERLEIADLESLLVGATLPVGEDFTRQVMKRLPEAGWEASSPAGWRLAAAIFVLLGAGSAFLALGEGGLASEMPMAGAALALFGLFRSALVAGAGLLTASWTGIGLALDELLGGSKAAFAVFGVLVLGVDLLFVRLLLRQRAARQRAANSPGAGGRSK